MAALAACGAAPARTVPPPTAAERGGTPLLCDGAGLDAVRDCSCGFGEPGRQRCGLLGWTACECAGLPVAGRAAPVAPVVAKEDAAADPIVPVVFEWPETDPSKATGGSCKAGHYLGEFACRLHIIETEGSGAFDVAGTIDMQLRETADGELLRIVDGTFASAALIAIPMTADIVGELNCSTSVFEGRLENGKFSVALGLPIPFTEGTFSGPLHSPYDTAAAALSGGHWNMTGELDGFPGSCMDGTWSARWVP